MPFWETLSSAWGWYSANRDNIIPIGGFVAGAGVAWAALRQVGIAVRRHHAQTEADRQRRITESFSKAVEQLSSDKIEARLGGIYTLERISRESEAEYWPVMELLTAFIRERGRWHEPDKETAKKLADYYETWKHPMSAEPRQHELATDVAAALTVIIRRDKNDRDREKAQGWRLDLSGADLREVDLHEVHLERVKFWHTRLEGAQLWKAHLEGAGFWGAHLDVAHFEGAHLEGAEFFLTHLRRTIFHGAHLKNAQFVRSFLHGAQFSGADLRGVLFWQSDLEGALDVHRAEGSNDAPSAIRGPVNWFLFGCLAVVKNIKSYVQQRRS